MTLMPASHTPSPVVRPPLIVVGASARALAASASRAGWSVWAADLFGDADLRATADAVVRVQTGADRPWPEGVPDAVRSFPVTPWLYVGALENHPDLVDRLAQDRPLAGNPGRLLRPVRDPMTLAPVVRAAGLAFPDTVASPDRLPTDGSYLVKPRAGAGGRGIARWYGGPSPAGDRVWQRVVRGRAASVAFAASPAGARLYGASRQLIGRGWCGARGFTWCGAVNVSVESIPVTLRARLDRLGAILADEFGLVGLVGVDLVVDPAGVAHVIEVNPRPTASLELVERATGMSVAATHLAACGFAARTMAPAGRASLPPAQAATTADRTTWAKAVVFASAAVVACERIGHALDQLAAAWTIADGGWPALADLPVPGTTIDAGSPLLTVFAAAGDEATALRTLRVRAGAIRAALRSVAVSPPAGAAARPWRPPRGRSA